MVSPPRVAESRIQMECRLVQVVHVSPKPLGGSLVIGEVVRFHVADELFDGLYVDPDTAARHRAHGRADVHADDGPVRYGTPQGGRWEIGDGRWPVSGCGGLRGKRSRAPTCGASCGGWDSTTAKNFCAGRASTTPEFWDACARECGIDWFEPYRAVLDDSRGPEWAEWFTGGQAEHRVELPGPPRPPVPTACLWEGRERRVPRRHLRRAAQAGGAARERPARARA